MSEWQYYPKSDAVPEHLQKVVNIFKQHVGTKDSRKFTEMNGMMTK